MFVLVLHLFATSQFKLAYGVLFPFVALVVLLSFTFNAFHKLFNVVIKALRLRLSFVASGVKSNESTSVNWPPLASFFSEDDGCFDSHDSSFG